MWKNKGFLFILQWSWCIVHPLATIEIEKWADFKNKQVFICGSKARSQSLISWSVGSSDEMFEWNLHTSLPSPAMTLTVLLSWSMRLYPWADLRQAAACGLRMSSLNAPWQTTSAVFIDTSSFVSVLLLLTLLFRFCFEVTDTEVLSSVYVCNWQGRILRLFCFREYQ